MAGAWCRNLLHINHLAVRAGPERGISADLDDGELAEAGRPEYSSSSHCMLLTLDATLGREADVGC